MSKNTGKKILNTLFLIVVFAVTVWSVFKGEDLSQIFSYLKTADMKFIYPAVVCVVLFILGESVNIYYLLRRLGTKVSFSHCCLYSFIGFFYSCITPSASGGQPMQIIAMRKDDIPIAVSSVVLAIVTITYKLVLVIMGAAVLIIRPDGIMRYLDSCESIIYIGMALNVVVIVLLLLLVFAPNIVRSLASSVLNFCNKIKPFKNPERQFERLERMIKQYEGASDFYRTHIPVIINVFVITFVQRVILFAVTWFTYMSFHLNGVSAAVVISLQGMISVASDMMPLPGGMGVSENLFIVIFEPIFRSDFVIPATVISRGISYYTQLILSAVMTVFSSFIIRDKSLNKVKNKGF